MWIKTNERVCVEIRKQHNDKLVVHASYTDVDGTSYGWSNGIPEIMTEWGFEKAKNPLYKVLMTKESREDKDWQYEYFLYCG
jgi:hypothetical protein